jgi:hypothetical protein
MSGDENCEEPEQTLQFWMKMKEMAFGSAFFRFQRFPSSE